MQKFLKKFLTIVLFLGIIKCFDAINPTIEANAAWKKDSTGWWYTEGNSYAKNTWRLINGNWYYFDNRGYMKTGWLNDRGTWYYLESSGAMKTGWLNISGSKYYLASNGAMKTGWVKDGQDWYYMNSSGAMQTGWIKDGANWYYLDPYNYGKMDSNRWMHDGYHLNYNGVWDDSSKYHRGDVFKNGMLKTEAGIVIYEAGDPSPLRVINGEPCVFGMSDNDDYYMIGLNSLNVYGEKNQIVDKAIIE